MFAQLTDLKNLSTKSASWLVEAGITTPDQLAEIGAVEAYARVKAMRPRVSIVMLWALHGAIEDIHFAKVAPEVKDMLKDLLQQRNAGR
jgi:DNA transformation protein